MADATATMAIVEVTEVIRVTAEETEDVLLALQPLLHVRLDVLRCLDRRWAVWAAVNPAHVGDDAALALRPLHDDLRVMGHE